MVGALEEEYPETPWFVIEVGDAPVLVELIEGVFTLKCFDHRVLCNTPDADAMSATITRFMAAQGFFGLEAV